MNDALDLKFLFTNLCDGRVNAAEQLAESFNREDEYEENVNREYSTNSYGTQWYN